MNKIRRVSSFQFGSFRLFYQKRREFTMRVLIPLANGVEELEAVTIIDVLRRGGIDITSAAIGDSLTIKCARGISLLADTKWSDLSANDFDVLVLPGGGKGTEALATDTRILDAVRSFNANGKLVAALCAAPTVLAKAGILKDRKATCYPTCIHLLGDTYEDAPVIADENIITSQGPGTAMLFSLVLVQQLTDEENAQRVASGLLTTLE
jgi:4-methyl-5(b-hydroxyethyl)-thiazole monophosphate biosynthesis